MGHLYSGTIYNSLVMEPVYMSVNKQIHTQNEMWYTHKVEFHSAIKKSKIISFAGKWIEMESIMLNKISQT